VVRRVQRVRDQLRDAAVVGEADVADRIERAGVLDVGVVYTGLTTNDVSCGVTSRSTVEARSCSALRLGDRPGVELRHGIAANDSSSQAWHPTD